MRRVRGAAVIAAVGMTLTGCAGMGGSTATVTKTVTVTQSAEASSTETDPGSDLALGRTSTLGQVDLTVSQIKKATSAYSQLPKDQQWWAAMVEGCATSDEQVSVSWQPWSITGADGGTYPSSTSNWDDFPRPQYPFSGDKPLPKGKCAKGWVMFALDAKTKPATVEYGNSAGESASWAAG